MSTLTSRHDSIFDKHAFRTPVTIIGVGGIGGYIAKGLADLGVGLQSPFEFYDGDVVEAHNLPNQVYGCFGERFLRRNKAEALAECIPLWVGPEVMPNVIAHPDFVTGTIPLGGIVFLSVDSMRARRKIVESSVWGNTGIIALVETRMNARYCAINILNPNDEHDVECWNKIWYSDEQADQDPGCGGHEAVGATSAIAGMLATQVFISMADFLKNRNTASLLPNQIEVTLDRFEMTTRVWRQ